MDDEQAKLNDSSPAASTPSNQLDSAKQMASSESSAPSDQETTPWDDLARTLGAEPSPEAMQRPHLENAPPHQESAIPAKQPAREPPEAPSHPTSGWGGLATELGITIDESPEDDSPIPVQTMDNKENSQGDNKENSQDCQPHDPAESRGLTGSQDQSLRDEAPAEAWGDISSIHKEEPSQVNFTEEPALFEENVDEPDIPAQKGLSGEVARSVFDALFLSGSAAAEALGNLLPSGGSENRKRQQTSTDSRTDTEQHERELSEPEPNDSEVDDQDRLISREETASQEEMEKGSSGRKTRRRRGRGRRRRAQGSGTETNHEDIETQDSHGHEPAAGDTLAQQGEPRDDSSEETDPFSEENSDEPRKSNARRRRPRRRRGRGHGVATRETDDPTISLEKDSSPSLEGNQDTVDHEADDLPGDVLPGDWETTLPPIEPNQQEPAAAGIAGKNARSEDPLTDQQDRGEEGDSDSQRGNPTKRPSHRNIPTWEEAMGVIVDSNLESRKNSPTPAGRSSSSRSRGRGGRRRKKT